jgi:EKC/KEOPS complex subunit CGI121/TPRKB
MESYNLPHFPVEHSSIHLAFFKNVTNSADLRKRLVAAATMEGSEGDAERDVLDYAFIEANMVSLGWCLSWVAKLIAIRLFARRRS